MARGTPSAPSTQTTPLSFDPELTWKFTKTMNMHDLARDDDFLSHLFVEKLGTGLASLNVHKMDPLRRLPKTEATRILQIVHRLICSKTNPTVAIKQSVSELLSIHPVRYFMKAYEQSQINAFATHASRYLELFLPTGSIEIAQTTRYSKWTGKSELCILATRAMSPGTVITELKGSMADLTDEEDKELARAGYRSENGVRRDFSVIHSKQMKKNHLFLGPARFVNHDCDNNCELFRTGRYITFRVIKPIAVGQEVTAHYGDGYFGRNNRHCLCETCEKLGRGGYAAAPDYSDDSPSSASSDDSGTETEDETQGSRRASTSAQKGKGKGKGKGKDSGQIDSGASGAGKDVSLDQRSTRRGVYVTLPESEAEDEADGDGDEEASGSKPVSGSASASHSDSKDKKASPQPKIEPLDAEAVPAPDDLDPTASRSVSVSTIRTRAKNTDTSSRASSSATLASSPLSSPSRPRRTSHSRSQDADDSISSRRPGRPKKVPHGRLSTSTASSPAPPVRNTPTMLTRLQKEREEEKEEESRTRRLRSSTAANASGPTVNKQGHNQLLGRGRNGVAKGLGLAAVVVKKKTKKVPCCMTCGNALPPKPQSNTPGEKTAPKAKPREEDCSRCSRHLSIYGAPWPQRISSGLLSRSQSHDPSPSNPLAVLDAKLKAVHESNKVQQDQEQKKKRAEEEREKERKRKEKENQKQRNKQKQKRPLSSAYSSVKRGIGKYMSRHAALTKMHASRQAANVERARSTKVTLTSKSPSGDSEEKKDQQPRQPGGRFAQKALTNGRYSRKRTRTYLAKHSAQSQSLKDKSRHGESSESEDDDMDSASPNTSKRHHDPRSSVDLPEAKRLKLDRNGRNREEDDDEVDDVMMIDDRRDKTFWPALPPLPACGSGFRRSGLLTARPNPSIVSRWRGTPDTIGSSPSEQATPKLVDDNTDNTDDEKSTTPATPDAEERLRVCVADPDTTPTPSVVTDVHAHGNVHEVDEHHSRTHSFSSDVIELDDDDVKIPASLTVSPMVPRRSSLPVLKGLGFRYKPYSTELPRRTWVTADTSSGDKTDNEDVVVVDRDEEVVAKKNSTLPRTPTARLRSSPVRNILASSTSANALSVAALLSPTRSLKKSSMLARYAGLVMSGLEPHASHVYKPLSSFTHLNKSSIDDDADSGEEDTLSGTADSIHFTLQKSVAFSSAGTSGNDMSASSTSLSEVLNQEATLITSRLSDSCLTSDHSTLARKTRPSLGHSSALHSCFVAQSTTPVKLVDAGWESSSDTSA